MADYGGGLYADMANEIDAEDIYAVDNVSGRAGGVM